MTNNKELSQWSHALEFFDSPAWQIEDQWYEAYTQAPDKYLETVSIYKFVFRQIPKNAKILELFPRDALCTRILSEFVSKYTALVPQNNINDGFRSNIDLEKSEIIESLAGINQRKFDVIVSLSDLPDYAKLYKNLNFMVKNGKLVLKLDASLSFDLKLRYVETLNTLFQDVLLFSLNGGAVSVVSGSKPDQSTSIICICCSLI